MDEKKMTDAVNASAATEEQRPLNEKPVNTIPYSDEYIKKNSDTVTTSEKNNAVNAINAKNPVHAQRLPEDNGSTTSDRDKFLPIVPLRQLNSNLPPFPMNCLPTTIRDFVSAVSAHSQTAPEMAAAISLGVMAVALQGKYEVEGNPGHTEQLSLYVVVIAQPGERKSNVLHEMTNSIYEHEMKRNEDLESEIHENRSLRRALKRKISSLEKSLERKYNPETEAELEETEATLMGTPVIEPVRYTTDDCTSEKLEELMAKYGGRFAVISSEGGIFDILAGRYSSRANIQIWLKGICGDPVYVDRIGRDPVSIPHPELSAILTIQPSILAEIMDNTNMSGRGLLARFLYVSPSTRIGSRQFNTEPIPSEILEDYQKLIYRLMDIPVSENPVILRLSGSARNLISDYFTQHERYLAGEGKEISDWASKYIGAVLRFAALLHVTSSDVTVSGEDEIPGETMNNAISIGEFFLSHARYAFSVMGTDTSVSKAQYVFAKLIACGRSDIKRSELYQMCRGKFFHKTEEIYPIVDLLRDHGYIRLEQPPQSNSSGRPEDIHVIINPDAVPKKNTG